MALKDLRQGMLLPMPVWDLPVRLFHVALIVLAAAALWSGWSGGLTVHRACGEGVLALLLFRLAWGFVGSDTARFSRWPCGPTALLRELGRLGERGRDLRVGHGPIGGWLALVMLALLAVVVGSGLAGDTALHDTTVPLLLGAVILHVLIVALYALARGHDLVRPMLTGRKRLPAATPAPRMVGSLFALAIAVLATAAAWLLTAWVL